MRWRVIREVAGISWREYLRTPEAIFWAYGFPLAMALCLGLAFGERPPEASRVAIVAHDEHAARLSAAIDVDGDELMEPLVLEVSEARRKLTSGAVDLVVSGPLEAPVFELDPMRPGSELARLRVERSLSRAAGQVAAITPTIEAVDEPGDRYIDFLIAGLIGINLLGAGIYGIGYNIVHMRVKNLLRRIAVTPIRRGEFLVGYLGTRLLMSLPAPFVILAFGTLGFGVPVQGSLLAWIGMVLCGAFAFCGIGLLIASRANTIETVSGLMNVFMLPMWIFGGAFFSNERFPEAMQWIVSAVPLTHLTDGLRAVMLGAGEPYSAAWAAVILLATGLLSYAVALRIFRWT